MKLAFLHQMMDTIGITEHDIYKMLQDSTVRGVLTDETIYSVAKYIDSVKGINIFLTKTIGDIEVRPKWFDNSVDFQMILKDGTVSAAVCLQLTQPYMFYIEFPVLKKKIIINLDLLDHNGDRDNTMELRIRVLNEVLTRYYSKTLYAIYKEIHRRR